MSSLADFARGGSLLSWRATVDAQAEQGDIDDDEHDEMLDATDREREPRRQR
jgi:hypothetical protein